jgi:PIN domain nuclease of toxin-antitoxin system
MGEVRLLLDTHVLLWWLFDDPKLLKGPRIRISDPRNEILVSSASAWEIATKFRLGKLPEAAEAAQHLPELIRKARMKALAVTIEHALLAGAFETHHRDPFDRMLAAQSQIENIPLISSDPMFAQFGIEVLW